MTSAHTHAGGGDAEAEWIQEQDERYEWVTRKYTAATLAGRARPPIGRVALKEMAAVGAHVLLVWKRDRRKGTESRWVMVAPSAVLRGEELLAHDPGLGLYAWRDFECDEVIGKYAGESLGVFDEGDGEGAAAALATLDRTRADKVLELERGARRVELIDGTAAGAPYLQRANDAYGLVGPTGAPRKNSARMGPDGTLRSLRRGGRQKGSGGERWQEVEEGGGWENLARREILWGYGRG